MKVASEAATAVAGRLVVELKAQREDEGEDELDQSLAIVKELEGGPNFCSKFRGFYFRKMAIRGCCSEPC
jgi:hypothetical protein